MKLKKPGERRKRQIRLFSCVSKFRKECFCSKKFKFRWRALSYKKNSSNIRRSFNMGKSPWSVILIQICRDQDPIFHMKAPNALINFLRYQKKQCEKIFLHKFLPWCSSGDVWVHASSQLSYFMHLLDAWFSLCYFEVSKKRKLYLVVWWGIDNRKNCDRKSI